MQKASVLDQAVLVSDNDDTAFFIGNEHSLQLWETDIETKAVRYQYKDGFTLSQYGGGHYDLTESVSSTQSSGDQLALSQKHSNDLGQFIDYRYRVGGGKMELLAINGNEDAIDTLLSGPLYEVELVLQDQLAVEDYAFAKAAADGTQAELISATIAPVLTVSKVDDNNQPVDRAWIVHDQAHAHAHGNGHGDSRLDADMRLRFAMPEGVATPTDLSLVADGVNSPLQSVSQESVKDSVKDLGEAAQGFYLFSHINKRLYYQARAGRWQPPEKPSHGGVKRQRLFGRQRLGCG